jgi:hypothetical protein
MAVVIESIFVKRIVQSLDPLLSPIPAQPPLWMHPNLGANKYIDNDTCRSEAEHSDNGSENHQSHWNLARAKSAFLKPINRGRDPDVPPDEQHDKRHADDYSASCSLGDPLSNTDGNRIEPRFISIHEHTAVIPRNQSAEGISDSAADASSQQGAANESGNGGADLHAFKSYQFSGFKVWLRMSG